MHYARIQRSLGLFRGQEKKKKYDEKNNLRSRYNPYTVHIYT